MTSEERAMLTELADKIAKTPTPAHDPEADEFIRKNIGNRPDALYILTQTTLIQNLAIEHAQQEIRELKQRATQPSPAQPSSSFLGGGARPAGGSSQWTAPASGPPPLPQSAPPSETPGEKPSFLRSAAQTAAGVAAGAFAFEGIRSLFGGGGFGGGWGLPHFGGGGSFLGGAPGGETIINNYYDNPDASERDVADRDDVDGTSADDSTADDSLADTSEDSTDDNTDASYDDGGGYDGDGGGYDDGGGSGGDDLV